MKPFQVTFHLYADKPEDVSELQAALYDLVMDAYQNDILVSAPKLTRIIKNYSHIIKAYFK